MASDPRETLEMLDRIEEQIPKDQPRLRAYVGSLRESIESDSRQLETLQEELGQYRQAYEKLTQPANRIGVFLKWMDTSEGSLGLVLLGDTEYVVTCDPNIDLDELKLGVRVRLNEAYAVVGLAPQATHGAMVTVADPLEDGRLRVGGDSPGSDQRIVFRSPDLLETKVSAGDEVRLDPSGRIAVEHIEKHENRDYFLENIPEIGWEKVGGQQEAIRLIRETIEQPLLYPELFESYGKKPVKGILLYGPPGCGKTLIGKATAHNLAKEYGEKQGKEVKEYFMAISGPKILNMWVGETERMVRQIFRTAREKAKDGYLVFIFMDEAEAILRTRSSGRHFSMSNTVVPQFCAELDGLEALDNVVLILTSNRPDYIDPAILRPGRIDRKVKVLRPDKDATRQILNIYLHTDLPYDPALISKFDGEKECAQRELVESVIDQIWSTKKEAEFVTLSKRNGKNETLYRSDFVSGALLESIVDRAKNSAIQRAISNKGGVSGISVEDLVQATEREFAENEIFPRGDSLADWIQLIDVPAEDVVDLRTSRNFQGTSYFQKNII